MPKASPLTSSSAPTTARLAGIKRWSLSRNAKCSFGPTSENANIIGNVPRPKATRYATPLKRVPVAVAPAHAT